METKDLYKVLGLKKGASADEIRRAYRRLARKHHPDANRDDPGAEERFKEIQHAHEVLSDPRKRQEYDEGPQAFFGSRDARTGARSPFGPGNFAPAGNFSDLSDVFGSFGDIFGADARRPQARLKGDDITISVNLNFRDALRGVTTRVGVPVEEPCAQCLGTGAAAGTSPRSCEECGGRGVKSRDQGFFALSEPCGRCGGDGVVVEHPCGGCGGAGRVRKDRPVTVKIPAGAKNGMKIRIPGRGSAGRRGGPAGDLIVVTRVEGHPVFERRGDDFVVVVPVSFVEAALGAEISVPRPEGGPVRLRLPAGTQDGKMLKVRGAGAPRPRGGGRGDLLVKVSLVVPRRLKKREREILQALADERDEDVRAELFRKVDASS